MLGRVRRVSRTTTAIGSYSGGSRPSPTLDFCTLLAKALKANARQYQQLKSEERKRQSCQPAHKLEQIIAQEVERYGQHSYPQQHQQEHRDDTLIAVEPLYSPVGQEYEEYLRAVERRYGQQVEHGETHVDLHIKAEEHQHISAHCAGNKTRRELS